MNNEIDYFGDHDYFGYQPSLYPDTAEKEFGAEMYEAVTLMESAEDKTARLMFLLDMAWSRGHQAAKLEAPEWANPFVHPDEAIERFDRKRRTA